MDNVSDVNSAIDSNDDLEENSSDSSGSDILEPWEALLKRLSTKHMDQLQNKFSNQENETLNKEEFVDTIDKILGNCRYSIQAISLFNQIINSKSAINDGTIKWTDFADFLSANICSDTCKLAELSTPNIFNASHVKRETIVKIVLIELESFFCYVLVAKYGSVGLYDGNMNFLTSYQIIMTREDVSRSDRERRRRNRWITDAIFLKDAMMFVASNSTRCLTIYDASGLEHVPLWLITDFTNAIQCITYCSKENDTRLIVGDDNGQIIFLKFLQPKVGLLRKKHNDSISIFYYQQIIRYEKAYVIIKINPKSHSERICQMEYFHDNHTLISCSRDFKNSIMIQQLFANGKNYYFSMPRGTACYSLSRNHHHLVTGSDDGILRIWNQFVTKKPIEVIRAHSDGIVDVKLIDHIQYAISCSRKGEVKLWDVKTYKCIQTLLIKYPCFGILGKLIEWGTTSIYPGPKRYQQPREGTATPSMICLEEDETQTTENSLLKHMEEDPWARNIIYITCCNYLAAIRINFTGNSDFNAEMPVLPHPPLQNSVLIPKAWKIRKNELNIEVKEENYSEDIKKYMDTLKFILEKDFLSENNLKHEINYRIAQLEAKKVQMRDKVKDCAPYLALDLFGIEEVKLSSNLPMPTRRRTQRLVEKTQRMLSAASSKTALFSESSSRSRSSRSSIIEFN